MTIGQRIKEKRKELGMTLEALANKLGKNRSTVYRYENGDIENMPLDVLEPIANALHTTPAYLMGWDQEQIDNIAEMSTDANEYSDEKENEMKIFIEEISEMVLTQEEMKEVFAYAKYLTSKRNQ